MIKSFIKSKLFIAIIIIVVLFLVWYFFMNKKKKEAEVIANTIVGDVPPPNPVVSAVNHTEERVSITKKDGTILQGYLFPEDISKLTFPLMVIAKDDVSGAVLQGSAVPAYKKDNPDYPITVIANPNTMNGSIAMRYEHLKKDFLIL